MGLFRFWQPHTDGYMLLWNAFVGVHTFRQLSETKKAEVLEHYARIVALNQLNFVFDVAALSRYDPFWLAFTMADLGISPILGPESAKWFYVSNPRKARNQMFEQEIAEELGSKVIRDVSRKHRILLDIEKLTIE